MYKQLYSAKGMGKFSEMLKRKLCLVGIYSSFQRNSSTFVLRFKKSKSAFLLWVLVHQFTHVFGESLEKGKLV
jgi:hypothetical protein